MHNKNTKLDKKGTGYSDDHTNITWKDTESYIKYDAFDNDLFVIENRLLREKKGIAIGGITLARLAELSCTGKEVQLLSQTEHAQAKQEAKYLPPGHLSSTPYRFRDNIVAVLRGNVGLARVQLWFECLYEVDLQQEGEGGMRPSPEATVSLLPLRCETC